MHEVTRILSALSMARLRQPSNCCPSCTTSYVSWLRPSWSRRIQAKRFRRRPWYMRRISGCAYGAGPALGWPGTFLRRCCQGHAADSDRTRSPEATHHPRRRRRRKELHSDLVVAPEPDENLLALDAALIKLAERDPLKARLVELRYFAGLRATRRPKSWDFCKHGRPLLGVFSAWLRRECRRRRPRRKLTKILGAEKAGSSH